MGYGGIDVDDLNEERAERDAARAQLAEVTRERDALGRGRVLLLDELEQRDVQLVSLRAEVSRLSALSTAHSQIASSWASRAARAAKTIKQISRLVEPPRCEACIREGRYTPCLECPEPGTPSGWVSGGGTSEVK